MLTVKKMENSRMKDLDWFTWDWAVCSSQGREDRGNKRG
jgi:hypothetical protein